MPQHLTHLLLGFGPRLHVLLPSSVARSPPPISPCPCVHRTAQHNTPMQHIGAIHSSLPVSRSGACFCVLFSVLTSFTACAPLLLPPCTVQWQAFHAEQRARMHAGIETSSALSTLGEAGSRLASCWNTSGSISSIFGNLTLSLINRFPLLNCAPVHESMHARMHML